MAMGIKFQQQKMEFFLKIRIQKNCFQNPTGNAGEFIL